MLHHLELQLADRAEQHRAADLRAEHLDRTFFVETTRTIEKYYRAVDMYVLPSIREGLPIALLEAMSSALPCVASRLPGSTDTLIEHDVSGLLVAPDDVEGLGNLAAMALVLGATTAEPLPTSFTQAPCCV